MNMTLGQNSLGEVEWTSMSKEVGWWEVSVKRDNCVFTPVITLNYFYIFNFNHQKSMYLGCAMQWIITKWTHSFQSRTEHC